jgi:PIN domain nuclease of toxin-antitoxin system
VRAVRTAVASAESVFVSAASAWEVAIKVQLGKLRIPGSFERAVIDSAFTRLPVLFAHAGAAGALPPHHADPFDRMLIAQAQVEGLHIMTADRHFRAYPVGLVAA